VSKNFAEKPVAELAVIQGLSLRKM